MICVLVHSITVMFEHRSLPTFGYFSQPGQASVRGLNVHHSSYATQSLRKTFILGFRFLRYVCLIHATNVKSLKNCLSHHSRCNLILLCCTLKSSIICRPYQWVIFHWPAFTMEKISAHRTLSGVPTYDYCTRRRTSSRVSPEDAPGDKSLVSGS